MITDEKQLRKFRKDTQFFPTPDDIADNMARLAGIGRCSRVLEPSAGIGSLIGALKRENPFDWFDEVEIDVCEKLEEFRNSLSGYNVVGSDFLEFKPNDRKYDLIIMNPPYSKNQAIKHVRHAWNHLNSNGRIVVLLPKGKQSDILYEEFIAECANFEIQPRSFKRTSIETVIMTIDKPIY